MKAALLGSGVDRLLLTMSLFIIGALWWFISSQLQSGPTVVEIYSGKQLLATYAMPGAGEPEISFEAEGELGLSGIVIDHEGVHMAYSPCSTQHCVLSGSHKHAGDIIACVPNKILVVLRGRSAGSFDAVVE